jgi:hypothetical protein
MSPTRYQLLHPATVEALIGFCQGTVNQKKFRGLKAVNRLKIKLSEAVFLGKKIGWLQGGLEPSNFMSDLS